MADRRPRGLFDAWLDVSTADLTVGTSAGATALTEQLTEFWA